MSKPLIITLATVVLLGLTTFGVSSHLSGVKKNETITEQQLDIESLEKSVSDTKADNAMLQNRVNELENYVAELEGKIASYETEIQTLKGKLAAADKKVKAKERELADLRNKYFKTDKELKAQLSRTAATQTATNTVNAADKAKIAELSAQLNAQRIKLDAMYADGVNSQNELVKTQNDLLAKEVEKHRNERIKNIIEVTTVNFLDIKLREYKDSRDLNRVQNKGKKWNYTAIEFFMQHTDLQSLIDENFMIKVVDVDTKIALAHIETNPSHPDSSNNATGKIFQFSGEKVTQFFKNTDLKDGKNYEIQIFYLDSDKAYPLKYGTKQFVFNKKVV